MIILYFVLMYIELQGKGSSIDVVANVVKVPAVWPVYSHKESSPSPAGQTYLSFICVCIRTVFVIINAIHSNCRNLKKIFPILLDLVNFCISVSPVAKDRLPK